MVVSGSRSCYCFLMVRISLLMLSGVLVMQASNILNTPTVDSSLFRVTQFASGQPVPNSVIRAKDGSLLAVQSPGFSEAQVVRYVDANGDGVADGAPTVLYSNQDAGPGTQIRSADQLYYVGEFGTKSITALSPGANAGDPLTAVGSLQFQYPDGHGHPTPGIAVRKTPGTPGSVDLVFNVGSEFNGALSSNSVIVSGMGLAAVELQGDSLYMITINEASGSPTASNLRQVATGIRNVYGMAFHPVTGDLYFADNAIDENNRTNFTEPPQADELNRILAGKLGTEVLRFGYPNCYPQYRTNLLIETGVGDCDGVTTSLINFQPVPNGASGARSEGPAEIAFAPSLFPGYYKGGLFVGFSGDIGPQGTNDQNPLVFVNSTNSALQHFIASGTIGNILGVYSTDDSLFVADWFGGSIYQIQAIEQVPEPGTIFVGVFGVALAAWARFDKRRRGAVS
jgi:glucose/arabinose dehydrogenase